MENSVSKMLQEQDGSITGLNIFFIVAAAIVSGVAIDVASLVSARTHLQTTADAAAHAALEAREWVDADDAKEKAIEIVEVNMPKDKYGPVLTVDDIAFGDFDNSTNTFTPDPDSRNAVIVRANRDSLTGNAVASHLFSMIGLPAFDVRTTSVYETYYPTCLIEGFVAENVVDIQSNNSYFNGFCLHSNAHVAVNQNNFFESGTIVSMPDTNDLVVPNNGLDDEKNEGLLNALREGRWFIKLLNRLNDITNGVLDENTKYAQPYITDYEVLSVSTSGKKVTVDDFTPGRIHRISCNSSVTFETGVYSEIVAISDCPMDFQNNVQFIDAVIITTNTGSKAMDGSHLTIGLEDDCASGGGAILVSHGGFQVAQGLRMSGGQIIAAGNVEFQAAADGVQGASIVAGGRIDGTSNMEFAFCGSGMEHVFQAEYFRLGG